MHCSRCDTKIVEKAKFCHECGLNLHDFSPDTEYISSDNVGGDRITAGDMKDVSNAAIGEGSSVTSKKIESQVIEASRRAGREVSIFWGFVRWSTFLALPILVLITIMLLWRQNELVAENEKALADVKVARTAIANVEVQATQAATSVEQAIRVAIARTALINAEAQATQVAAVKSTKQETQVAEAQTTRVAMARTALIDAEAQATQGAIVRTVEASIIIELESADSIDFLSNSPPSTSKSSIILQLMTLLLTVVVLVTVTIRSRIVRSRIAALKRGVSAKWPPIFFFFLLTLLFISFLSVAYNVTNATGGKILLALFFCSFGGVIIAMLLSWRKEVLDQRDYQTSRKKMEIEMNLLRSDLQKARLKLDEDQGHYLPPS